MNDEMKETEKNRAKSGKTTVFSVIICILLACSIGVSCFIAVSASRANQKLSDKLDSLSEDVKNVMNGDQFGPEAEDDIVIMDEYTIRSTLPISDAYKSGDTSALDDRQKETLAMASAVLDEIITDGMTDYEKELAVYTWLTTKLKNETGHLTVIHSDDTESDNPYGVLKYRNAVCVGYATTFRMFMQMMGIECKVVHSSDRVHSWDLVNLEGDWYHVDCYMDADSGSFRNFNQNDDQRAEFQQWSRDFFPAARCEKYSYSMMHLKELGNIYDIAGWVADMIKEGDHVGSCSFKERITEKNEAEAAALTEMLFDTLGSSEKYCYHSFEYSWSESAEHGYVLTLYITYPEDMEEGGEDIDIDPAVYDKINKSITDAFGEEIFETNDLEEDWEGEDYVEANYARG